MISLVANSELVKKLNLEVIKKKIEYARESESMKFHLQNLQFDQRFTKPFNLSGWDILDVLYHQSVIVFIGTYRQNYFAWKFTPVNAYKPSDRKDVIKINTRQLYLRSKESWEETIWHELVHIADHLSSYTFDHGHDNDLSGKDHSAPVKFAKVMAAMTLPEFNKKELENVH